MEKSKWVIKQVISDSKLPDTWLRFYAIIEQAIYQCNELDYDVYMTNQIIINYKIDFVKTLSRRNKFVDNIEIKNKNYISVQNIINIPVEFFQIIKE